MSLLFSAHTHLSSFDTSSNPHTFSLKSQQAAPDCNIYYQLPSPFQKVRIHSFGKRQQTQQTFLDAVGLTSFFFFTKTFTPGLFNDDPDHFFFFGTMTFLFFWVKNGRPPFHVEKIAEILLPLCVVVRYSLALMVMVASGHLILSRQNPIEPLWITYYVSRWWFQRFFIFTPIRGKWSNLTNIFFKWVVQPPTRFL